MALALYDVTTNYAVYADGQGGYVDSTGNAVDPNNVSTYEKSTKKGPKRIVITQRTLDGIGAIMRLARSGGGSSQLFRKRRRRKF